MRCPCVIATEEYGKKGRTRKHHTLEKFVETYEQNYGNIIKTESCPGKLELRVVVDHGGCPCCDPIDSEIFLICTHAEPIRSGLSGQARVHIGGQWDWLGSPTPINALDLVNEILGTVNG